MTVAELIEELKKHPPDAYVVADSDSEFGGLDEGLILEPIRVHFFCGQLQETFGSFALDDAIVKHSAVRFQFRIRP
jgi:hypothetical protein